jgi:hypothetical protein
MMLMSRILCLLIFIASAMIIVSAPYALGAGEAAAAIVCATLIGFSAILIAFWNT